MTYAIVRSLNTLSISWARETGQKGWFFVDSFTIVFHLEKNE